MVLNVIGAAATGATLCVVLASKFTHGAWIALVLTGGMLVLFRQVRRHYDFITRVTATEASRLFVIAHHDFHALMDEMPSVRQAVLDCVAERLRSAETGSAN